MALGPTGKSSTILYGQTIYQTTSGKQKKQLEKSDKSPEIIKTNPEQSAEKSAAIFFYTVVAG